MKLTPPQIEDFLQSAAELTDRIKELEDALKRISDLDVGVWPSWEMGRIAREALGPTFERQHWQERIRWAQENGG